MVQPPRVQDASGKYRDRSVLVDRFLSDVCEIRERAGTP
jgi:hypothetical protein